VRFELTGFAGTGCSLGSPLSISPRRHRPAHRRSARRSRSRPGVGMHASDRSRDAARTFTTKSADVRFCGPGSSLLVMTLQALVQSEPRVPIALLSLVLGGRDTAADLPRCRGPRGLPGLDGIAAIQC